MRIELGRDDTAGLPWAVAADRRLEPEGPVLAVDLSGDPLVFGTDAEHRFAVRPLTAGDLPILSTWVQAAHVARWWDEHRTVEELATYYGPALRGEEATRLWVFEVNGRSVGFAQDYRISDHPDYALLCGRPDAVGFDYLIGDPAFVGRGLGTSLLWVFLRDIVWPAYASGEFFAAPDHRNAASRRVLAKLGFTEGTWFDERQADGRIDTVVGCSLDVAQVMGTHEATGE